MIARRLHAAIKPQSAHPGYTPNEAPTQANFTPCVQLHTVSTTHTPLGCSQSVRLVTERLAGHGEVIGKCQSMFLALGPSGRSYRAKGCDQRWYQGVDPCNDLCG